MSKTIIKIENLSKQYRLGTIGTGTIAHDLNRWWQTKILRNDDPYLKIGETNDRAHKGLSEYVWALKDINLEIKEGDVVGIIGKNGAGKSTLLKILSRVTAPTTGSIKVNGRLGSLLEVGTGFHPELTGRENIFLNGAILGMTKAEIRSKLDEIIDFSGCERYIDTPVKRYSSGMNVRLGFAVAAFLEPEILVVDEVLAVGDAEFQKKAIGKMQDVSQNHGRTVLFVSHNMGSVRDLCEKAIVMKNGNITFNDSTENAIDYYLSQNSLVEELSTSWINNKKDINNEVYIEKVELLNKDLNPFSLITNEDEIKIKVQYTIHKDIENLRVVISLHDHFNTELFCTTDFLAAKNCRIRKVSKYENILTIPKRILNYGNYTVKVRVDIPKLKILAGPYQCISFNIEEMPFNQMGIFAQGEPKGIFHFDLNWRIKKI